MTLTPAQFIVKEQHWATVVMSRRFEELDKSLMVEIIRLKQAPPPAQVGPRPPDHQQSTDQVLPSTATGGGSQGTNSFSPLSS